MSAYWEGLFFQLPNHRAALASTCCGSCFSGPATVILPFTTSAVLHQLVQVKKEKKDITKISRCLLREVSPL